MRVAAVVGSCLALVMLAAPPAAKAGPLEFGVVNEINFARTHPAEYAEVIRREADNGALADTPRDTREAADFLDRQTPLPALRLDARLETAAAEYARRQGPRGGLGHAGEASGESLNQRLHQLGVWAGLSAETISYGHPDPREVVIQLIIDGGVPGRGHRLVLFDPTLQQAGAGCARHSRYGEMCVVDFAGAIVKR